VKPAAAAAASNDFIDGFASAFASHDRKIAASDTFSSAAASQACAPLDATTTPPTGTQRQVPSSNFAVGSSFNDFDEGEVNDLRDEGGGARVPKTLIENAF
jgi:hypothetical protein